jgi:hypothetical protein
VSAHALGHVVAARLVGGRLLPAQWLPGAAMSLLLAPVQVATGPFLAERVRLSPARRRSTWRVHAAGPLANAMYAAAIYALYLVQPMPFLRAICLVQLAAIGYALLPIEPLDGAAIGRAHPTVLLAAGIAVTVVSSAFALGLL